MSVQYIMIDNQGLFLLEKEEKIKEIESDVILLNEVLRTWQL